MREILLKLFSTDTGAVSITWMSVWHLLYLLLIFGGTAVAAVLLRGAPSSRKEKTLRVLAYAVPTVYIADFFCMPLAHDSFSIDVGKLPFHICTFLAAFIAFAQFNSHFRKWRDIFACLSTVCSFFFLLYPGTAIGDFLPWSYRVFQTMLYHALMFAWGVLTLAVGGVNLRFENLWKAAVFIMVAVAWALFGNVVYSWENALFDWFMVTGRSVPFMPAPIMPFVVFAVVFAGCAVVFAIDSACKKRKNNS